MPRRSQRLQALQKNAQSSAKPKPKNAPKTELQRLKSELISMKSMNIRQEKTIDRLKNQNNKLTKERTCDRKELVKQLKKTDELLDKIKLEYDIRLKNLKDQIVLLKEKEEVEKEREIIRKIRGVNVELMRKMVEDEVGRNGESFPWQMCQICLLPYGNDEENTPRMLACGHTLCLGCAKKLSTENGLKCPFDRMTTLMDGLPQNELPKNYAVLEMCD